MDHQLIAWILDYIAKQQPFVRPRECVSDTTIRSTGAPQGTDLATFLPFLYTADFRHNTASYVLQKFLDESALVGLIMDDNDSVQRLDTELCGLGSAEPPPDQHDENQGYG